MTVIIVLDIYAALVIGSAVGRIQDEIDYKEFLELRNKLR